MYRKVRKNSVLYIHTSKEDFLCDYMYIAICQSHCSRLEEFTLSWNLQPNPSPFQSPQLYFSSFKQFPNYPSPLRSSFPKMDWDYAATRYSSMYSISSSLTRNTTDFATWDNVGWSRMFKWGIRPGVVCHYVQSMVL